MNIEKQIIKSQKGFALVITLLLLAVLTAMVIEFSYGVYTTTSSLHNWQESQRLSLIAKSGVSLAVKTIADIPQHKLYKFPPQITIPVSGLLTNFQGDFLVTVQDENSRFNINSIINENQTLNRDAYNLFRRLLKNLGLKEEIADFVADWIDRDNEPRIRDAEENAKNSSMESIDELLLIKGVDMEIYTKLLPHITVYPADKANPQLVNINTATEVVIMSIVDGITKETAERIIRSRPFDSISSVEKAAPGFGLGPTKVIVKPTNFRIIATAEENKIKRLIESVIEIKGNTNIIRYWKET